MNNVNNVLQKNNLTLPVESNLYLYGHPSFDNIDNRHIILATIKYIKETGRFSKS